MKRTVGLKLECGLAHIYMYNRTVPSRKRAHGWCVPYIGPRLGDGPIFEVSVSDLYANAMLAS